MIPKQIRYLSRVDMLTASFQGCFLKMGAIISLSKVILRLLTKIFFAYASSQNYICNGNVLNLFKTKR